MKKGGEEKNGQHNQCSKHLRFIGKNRQNRDFYLGTKNRRVKIAIFSILKKSRVSTIFGDFYLKIARSLSRPSARKKNPRVFLLTFLLVFISRKGHFISLWNVLFGRWSLERFWAAILGSKQWFWAASRLQVCLHMCASKVKHSIYCVLLWGFIWVYIEIHGVI